MPDTLFKLTPLAKSASEYTSTTLSFSEPLNVKATSIVLCSYLMTCWTANQCFVAPAMCLAKVWSAHGMSGRVTAALYRMLPTAYITRL